MGNLRLAFSDHFLNRRLRRPKNQERLQDDPIRRALTSSVSFGRFVSESFALDRWSSFNQNRYLEEAEKYSKPGSVAQKKAYFEAHYKKIAAAKKASSALLLDQQQSPAAVDDDNENDNNNPAAEMELAQASDESTLSKDILLSVEAKQSSDGKVNEESCDEQEAKEGTEPAIEHSLFMEIDVEPSSNPQENEESHDEQEAKETIENPSTLEGSAAPTDKDEAAFSSRKPSSKFTSSVKPSIPICPRKGEHAGNHNNKRRKATQFLEKKRPKLQALHMSISFTSGASSSSETNKPVLKTSAETSNPQPLIRASVGGMQHHLRFTPQLENGRTKTLLDQSLSRGKKPNSSLLNGKSKPVCGSNVVKSPTLASSSFSLRSEERAAKRKEDDSIRRALTSSVSFGRFVSESLAWDKWSSFNQKRYLEEAEKYSKPGSVAQKKAYFEANYKKIAAAFKKAASSALLLDQQQSPAADDDKENGNNNPAAEMELAQASDENALSKGILLSVEAKQSSDGKVNEESCDEQGAKEGTEQAIEHPLFMEIDVKPSSNPQENDEQEANETIENPSTLKDSAAPTDKDEAAFSSRKPSSKVRSSVKPSIPICPRKGDHAGNHNNKRRKATQFLEKKRPNLQALHMSINFTSGASSSSETNKPVLKTSAETSNPQPLIRASVGGMQHLRFTPQLENGRTKTLLDHQSVSGCMSRGKKPNSSLQNGKSKPLCGSNVKSPTLSSSFSLRSEERAAKRKEFFQKLEQKLNLESKRERLQSIQKGKAKGGSSDVFKSVSSLAEAKANFHSSTKSTRIATEKIPTQCYIPKFERKLLASEAQDYNSRPPWRFSMKTDCFRDMSENNSCKVNPKKSIISENASPNIHPSMYKGFTKGGDACRRSMKNSRAGDNIRSCSLS